jgi:triphosphatase
MKPGTETEVELKFLLTPALAKTILASNALPALAGTHEHDPIANYYYDTPDFDLQKRGFALRLRKKKGQFIQSLKGGGYNDHALHSRQEWNHFIPGLTVVPALLRDTPVADLVTSGKLNADLKPLFLTDIQRELWHAPWKQSVVEIALDQGFIVVGDQKQMMNELEIELVSGSIDDLLDLAKHVQALWSLQPIEISKAAQGYAFLASL